MTVASSVVCAQLLNGFQTAQFSLKILFPLYRQSLCSIDVRSALSDELCSTLLFICVEIVVTHRHNLQAVVRTFRNLMRSTLPCGGKVFLFLADVRQTLMAVKASEQYQIVNECFEQSIVCLKTF